MRTLATGLTVLALAVLVTWIGGERTWNSSQRPGQVSTTMLGSIAPSAAVSDLWAGSAISPGREPGVTPRLAPANRAAPDPRAAPSTASRPGGLFGPPPRVTQHPAGSAAHAKAIAASIASPEFQDTVSPLARLYFATFGRYPDAEGLDYYARQRLAGMSLDAIAEEFAGSAEFEMLYGTLDNAGFVDRMLRNAGADASQRGRLIAQLDSGAMTRGGLMITYSEDAGFAARLSNRVFVSIAYAETLNRTPDPAGFARWVAYLDAGNPRQAVISGLLGSR